MRKLIVLFLMVVAASSCRKDLNEVASPTKQNPLNTMRRDSIPDSACFKIQILKDSTRIDETAVAFFHFATPTYNKQLDAEYFAGFGLASLSTVTTDGVSCAIQCIPFKQINIVRLNVGSRQSNNYLLKLSYLNKFPDGTHLWLKDKLSGDSVDLRSKNYPFSISKSDTSTFGKERFKVIVQ